MHFHWPITIRSALIAACLLLAVACQKAEPRYSATLDRESLMPLAFPTWKTDGPELLLPVDLSATAQGKTNGPPATSVAKVEPFNVIRLDATHAVMLTHNLPIFEADSSAYACHACPGIVGAYFFEQDEKGWRMTARQDAAIQIGVFGEIGSTNIVKLADGHYALASEWDSCWQGSCGSWLEVLGLRPGKAKVLASGIALSVDNTGAGDACSKLDEPPTAEPDSEDQDLCHDFKSAWKFKDGRLTIDYEERKSKLDGTPAKRITEKIETQAIYEVANDSLDLVKGKAPEKSL